MKLRWELPDTIVAGTLVVVTFLSSMFLTPFLTTIIGLLFGWIMLEAHIRAAARDGFTPQFLFDLILGSFVGAWGGSFVFFVVFDWGPHKWLFFSLYPPALILTIVIGAGISYLFRRVQYWNRKRKQPNQTWPVN